MTNPKGTAAETKVVRWAHDNGYPHADRLTKTGNRDRGDVALCPGLIAEVKNYTLRTGVPTAGQLTEWMRQTELEREHARADVAVLIVKRPGTTDVGRWFAYVTAWTLSARIAGVSVINDSDGLDAPVCLAVADLTTLLRAAGWGTPLEAAA